MFRLVQDGFISFPWSWTMESLVEAGVCTFKRRCDLAGQLTWQVASGS